MKVFGNTDLPCGHHSTKNVKDGSERKCDTCKKKWTARYVISETATKMAGTDVFKLEWEPVE